MDDADSRLEWRDEPVCDIIREPTAEQQFHQQLVYTKFITSPDKIKSVHFYPKIGVSAVTAIISYIWLFPSSFKEHPILGRYIIGESPADNAFFTVLWIFTLMIAFVFWFYAVRIENREKNLKLELKLEYFQNRLFGEFISGANSKENFTKDDFAMYLNTSHKRERIDIELALSLAELIFTRAENKGIIEKESRKSFSDTYKLTTPEEK